MPTPRSPMMTTLQATVSAATCCAPTTSPRSAATPACLSLRHAHVQHVTWRRRSHVSATCRTDAGSGPPPLKSLMFRPVVGQLSEFVPFLLLQPWPAKRCYVCLVAVGVQEQAEDILVPPLLRNCLTLSFIFPSHYLPSCQGQRSLQ